jgi:hypothetical protein
MNDGMLERFIVLFAEAVAEGDFRRADDWAGAVFIRASQRSRVPRSGVDDDAA